MSCEIWTSLFWSRYPTAAILTLSLVVTLSIWVWFKMNQRRKYCHYKPVAGYQLENSTAHVTIIHNYWFYCTCAPVTWTKQVSQRRCKSTDAACIALQYFVLLSFVAVMLTHVLVIIINQSTITLRNFYYNYYYRRVFAYYYYYYIGSQTIYYYYYYTVLSNLHYYPMSDYNSSSCQGVSQGSTH